ncbi:MAG: ABC transporter permease [Fidelibacterota bacterium]|nr:MAG: ABC transporter permease [Candidatus Neomarinimicrobiota bacterium]
MIEILRVAGTALWAHKFRALLTTLGIAIGIFTVGVVMALIEGLNATFSEQISSLGSDVLYVDKRSWFMGHEEWLRSRQRRNIGMDAVDYIKQRAEYVSHASPRIQHGGTLKYRDKNLEGVSVQGVHADMAVISGTEIVDGRFLSRVDTQRKKAVAVIGDAVKENLFENGNYLGESFFINGRRFLVIGLLEKQGQTLGHDPDNMVYIPAETLMKMFGRRWRNVSIALKAADPDLVDEARDEAIGIMRRYRKLRPDQPDDFAINQQSTLQELYDNATRLLWMVAIGIGSIALIVGGVGVMNIMLVTVTERTMEIGIRKSLGARRSTIRWQFLVESMTVSALGVVVGFLLASGAALVIQRATPLMARIPPSWGGLGIGVVVVVGVVFGLWPATKAARLDPIEALRYE